MICKKIYFDLLNFFFLSKLTYREYIVDELKIAEEP